MSIGNTVLDSEEEIVFEKKDLKHDMKEEKNNTQLNNKKSKNKIDQEEWLKSTRIIDCASAKFKKTQKNWTDYFNSRNEAMVSMPDLYLMGKYKEGNYKFFSDLKSNLEWTYGDFGDGGEGDGVVTSTRIKYEKNHRATITHYLGSDVREEIKHNIIIPKNCFYNPNLNHVSSYDDCLLFLQALFETNDNGEEILKTVKNLEVDKWKKERNIILRVLDLESEIKSTQETIEKSMKGVFSAESWNQTLESNKKAYQESLIDKFVVGFYGDEEELYIDCYMPLNAEFHSYGLKIIKTK